MMHDVVGVGFGPANLALSIAVAEAGSAGPTGRPLDAVFLERQPEFGWHRDMLIDGATMQVSFLKDLVTLRNPVSEFSFLNYLHERSRLVDFINHKILFPTRLEFHDYLEWAAARMSEKVHYSTEVTGVVPVLDGDVVDHFEVRSRTIGGGSEIRYARNVVVAAGLRPKLPAGVAESDRVWHNGTLLSRVESLPANARKLVVVGAGQSAAETAEYLHRTYPDAEVCAVFSRYGYTPADDTPFANRIFDPEAVDHFHTAPEHVKQKLMDYHRLTNYSAVDTELITELYRREYAEKVSGRRRLRIMGASSVTDCRPRTGGVDLTVEFQPTGERTELAADAVVYATGYREFDPSELLGETDRMVRRDASGAAAITRDYRVELDAPARGGLYLQGGTEHSHGITSSLLSNAAVRAGEVLDSLLAERAARNTVTYA